MNIGGAGTPIQGSVFAGGASLLKAASRAETETKERMLPLDAAQNAGRAASEAKGLFVDTYA